jgi:hypothetical protein
MDMLTQDVLETGAGHGIIASIGEQFWNPNVTADRQPRTNRGCRFFPQRQATFFSAFAVNQNAGLRLQHHIFDPESHQFRDPQSTREAEMKHRPVTDARPDSWVRGIQDRLHLLGSEVPDEPSIRLFRRMARIRWICSSAEGTRYSVVHERFDSCERIFWNQRHCRDLFQVVGSSQ